MAEVVLKFCWCARISSDWHNLVNISLPTEHGYIPWSFQTYISLVAWFPLILACLWQISIPEVYIFKIRLVPYYFTTQYRLICGFRILLSIRILFELGHYNTSLYYSNSSKSFLRSYFRKWLHPTDSLFQKVSLDLKKQTKTRKCR